MYVKAILFLRERFSYLFEKDHLEMDAAKKRVYSRCLK